MRVITSGQGGSDIAAVITEFGADGQVIRERVLTGEMALVPELLFAYASNEGDNTITVFDTGTQNVVSTIRLSAGSSPRGLANMPDGSRVYAALSGPSGGVAVIDTATNMILTTIPLAGNDPQDVAITPDGTKAFVANFSSNRITVIDTFSDSVIATLPVGTGTRGVAITPILLFERG